MARTWFSIRVELVGGMHAGDLWPRPGRMLMARPGMTFRMLADAINDAFARWDRSHLHAFTFADGTRVGIRTPGDEPDDEDLDDTVEKLSRLRLGERFSFEFDHGDRWMHLCTVGDAKVDPIELYGERPDRPVAYFGWGSIPDQYGRRWDGDDGEGAPPPQPDPPLSDLPDLHEDWGSRALRIGRGDGEHEPRADAELFTGPWLMDDPSALARSRSTRPWTREDVRALRGAVFRRDARDVVELLAPRPAIEVAHLAATGLIHADRSGDDTARVTMIRLMDELSTRGWLGDDELVDEFERVVMGAPSGLRPVPVDLDDLATHLDSPSDLDGAWKLELSTGRFRPSDPALVSGAEQPEDFDDPDAFIPVIGFGSNVGYGDMRDFIGDLEDGRLAERLSAAIDGRGAFRRFRDVLQDDGPSRDAWGVFSSERWLARARWWLADAGLRPEVPGDP